MAFNLHQCSWFLSRERSTFRWFIELKPIQLILVLRREGTPLNRNLVLCASLLKGLCKVTENASIVTKSAPTLCSTVLSDLRTILHSPHVDHKLANPKIFVYFTDSRVNMQAILFCWKIQHSSCKSLSDEDSKNFVIPTSLKEVCIL